jgi:hypothetical protein
MPEKSGVEGGSAGFGGADNEEVREGHRSTGRARVGADGVIDDWLCHGARSGQQSTNRVFLSNHLVFFPQYSCCR